MNGLCREGRGKRQLSLVYFYSFARGLIFAIMIGNKLADLVFKFILSNNITNNMLLKYVTSNNNPVIRVERKMCFVT